MDVISHGLWGGAGFYHKSRKSFWTAFAFGVLPDILAFFWPFTILLYQIGLGQIDFTKFEPPVRDTSPQYVHTIYNFTHNWIVLILLYSYLIYRHRSKRK